jgi:hypothetical protein
MNAHLRLVRRYQYNLHFKKSVYPQREEILNATRITQKKKKKKTKKRRKKAAQG